MVLRLIYPFQIALSFVASLLRFGVGASAPAVRQEKPLILYEFEGCPFCRIAREAVSQSGVRVIVRPCPKGGKKYRRKVAELGGKSQFPYIVDPNTSVSMYESNDIAAYIHKTYGGARSLLRFLGPFDQVLSQFGVLVRLMRGTFAFKSIAPELPLEFYGAERDPRARLVKERLCELELEYEWAPKTPDGESGPMLIDPNMGETIKGPIAIRQHLNSRYRP